MKKFVPALNADVTDALRRKAEHALHMIEANSEAFACTWEELFSHMPEGDYEMKVSESGCLDWEYSVDDDHEDDEDGGWRKGMSAIDIFRKDGKEWIEVLSYDDCDWDTDCEITKEDYERDPREYNLEMALHHCYWNLLRNHLYSIYCVATGLDPLDNILKTNATKQDISDISARDLVEDVEGLCEDVKRAIRNWKRRQARKARKQ